MSHDVTWCHMRSHDTRLYWCGESYTVCISIVDWEMAAVSVNCKRIIIRSLCGNSCFYTRVRNLWATWNTSSCSLVCGVSFFRVATQRKWWVKLHVALFLSKIGICARYGSILSTTLYHHPGCTTGKNLYIVSLKGNLAWGCWDLKAWESVMFTIRDVTRRPWTCEGSWPISVCCVRLLYEFCTWPIHTGDHDTCRGGKGRREREGASKLLLRVLY